MSVVQEQPVHRSWLRRGLLLLVATVLLAAAYLSSDAFERRLRAAFIETLEQATGGKVEIGSFAWSLSRLEFEAVDLTLRGREPLGQLPLLSVPRLRLRLKILSFLGAQVGVRDLEIERPVLRLVTGPDGAINLPEPPTAVPAGRSPVATLFDLALDRLRISEGELHWDNRRVPFSADAAGVNLLLSYSRRER
ncbi:MAG: hypothetical protein ACRD3I_11600, partial [Terriglobales bacterium]